MATEVAIPIDSDREPIKVCPILRGLLWIDRADAFFLPGVPKDKTGRRWGWVEEGTLPGKRFGHSCSHDGSFAR
jgi:hypothetical protein